MTDPTMSGRPNFQRAANRGRRLTLEADYLGDEQRPETVTPVYLLVEHGDASREAHYVGLDRDDLAWLVGAARDALNAIANPGGAPPIAQRADDLDVDLAPELVAAIEAVNHSVMEHPERTVAEHLAQRLGHDQAQVGVVIASVATAAMRSYTSQAEQGVIILSPLAIAAHAAGLAVGVGYQLGLGAGARMAGLGDLDDGREP